MAKKSKNKYFVLGELPDNEFGVEGPFKTLKKAIHMRNQMRKWDNTFECYVVRRVKG